MLIHTCSLVKDMAQQGAFPRIFEEGAKTTHYLRRPPDQHTMAQRVWCDAIRRTRPGVLARLLGVLTTPNKRVLDWRHEQTTCQR